MSDHGHFSSYEGHKERRTGKIRGTFSRMHRALDGWMLARAPASLAQGLHHQGPRYFNFFISVQLLLLLLFLTFSALVANPKKTTLHGGQSRSWSAEQGKKKKKKKSGSAQCVALGNLDLLIKTGWSVILRFFAENAGRR